MNIDYDQLEKITEIDENKDVDGDNIYYITEYFLDLDELFIDIVNKIYENQITKLLYDTYINDIQSRINIVISNKDLLNSYKMITEKKLYDQIENYILLYNDYTDDLQTMYKLFKRKELQINENLNRIDPFILKNDICYDVRGLLINFLS